MRYSRTILIVLFLIVGFSSFYSQDSNVVNYSLFLEKSVGFGTVDTKIDEGSFKEGQSFLIPEAILPNSPIDFSMYQDLYSALVGGRFGIDYGALNNDIIMKIFIRNLNPNFGEYLTLGERRDTLFSYFEIRIWELPDSNYYPEESSYYFNEGYFARFSLPKSEELKNFLSIAGISYSDSLAFAFLEDSTSGITDWNRYGIETIDDPDSVKFKAIHLSRIGGGRKRIANKDWSETIVLGAKLKELKGLPNKMSLGQNYPNPFNPSTKISYSIVKSGDVKIDLYNILGKHIINLVDSYQSAGNYEVAFSTNSIGKSLPSGFYIYTLKNNNVALSKKMILMK